MKKIIYTSLALATLLFSSCENYLERIPVDSYQDQNAITTGANAKLAKLGLYSSLQATSYYALDIMAFQGLLSDELNFTGSFTNYREMDNISVLSTNSGVSGMYTQIYSSIYRANTVIERVPMLPDSELDASEKNVILAHAKFIRALGLFNATLYWGDVPLPLTGNVNDNKVIGRSPQAEVLKQIISDFKEAADALPTGATTEEEKTTATSWAALAMLSKVHLFAASLGDKEANSELAEKYASQVINSQKYTLCDNFEDVFAGRSSESILEVFFSNTDNGAAAFWFFTSPLGGRYEFGPSGDVDYWLTTFGGSERKKVSVAAAKLSDAADAPTVNYVYKYKDVATGVDPTFVIRLAEVYLIRAEANANLGKESAAIEDLNIIRERAGVAKYPSVIDKREGNDEIFKAILTERSVELAFEGHRFFDLIRMGFIGETLAFYETWTDDDKLLPIPQREIQTNPNMTQNPGY